ncbi:SCO7613 C-terminal domain-containing membrane protein [Streptomyces sp. NPDC059564]|uniref:SCO7613 C-terminal domain-containing membrane protein n=1 Tax=Streptomyces sp. NPDC059564 TaxID=3346865 RepID=UPI00367BF914
MDNPLPPAGELALIDRELARLDARRGYLLARRAWLVGLLSQSAPASAAPAPAARGGGPAPSAQTVLLTLGAVLLAVAALAFTLVSWGSLGIGGRSAVLAVLTAAALAAPAGLLRRGLRSTAESVAGVGLLLTVLDAYALHAVGLPGTDGGVYAVWAAAALAALWAGYGAALGRLRLPLVSAVLAAQLPLPLAAAVTGADPLECGWALLATAALDAALAVAVARRAVRVAAWTASGALGGAALAVGLALSLDAPGAAGPAGLLAAGALLGVAVAAREPRASAAALVGGLAGISAVGALVPAGAGSGWGVAVRAATALALLAAAGGPAPARRAAATPGPRAASGVVTAGRTVAPGPAAAPDQVAAPGPAAGVPGPVRRGLLRAGAGVAVLGALAGLPAVAVVLASRLGVLDEVWAATTPRPAGYLPGPALAVTLLLAAAALAWPAGVLPRRESRVAAVVCAGAGLFAAPVLAGLPVAAALGAQLAVTAAAGVLALRAPARAVAFAAGGCAAAGALNVSLAALDGRLATFAVFGLLGTGCALGAAYGAASPPVRGGAAVGAVSCAAATAVALGALAGLAAPWQGVAALAVPAAVVALAPRLGPVRVPAEAAAAAAGVLAVVPAAGDPPVLALVLALDGVLCAAAALRADRRALGWAAGALAVAAAWVRLGASGVVAPEAYTLPVSVLALAVGGLRRRRDRRASSWVAYGPGLAATLLPSLFAAWGDAHWVRPLLLGLASLALTLAGARRRLRAPLLLGGATLAAVALHELAPYVVQVVGVLPRWLPPALAGLLLLAVGATYEKRLRDARRLREALGRLD